MLSNETEINPYCIMKTSVMEKKEKSVGTSNSLDPAHCEETLHGSFVCNQESSVGSDVCSPETIVGSDVCSPESIIGSDFCSPESIIGSDFCSRESIIGSDVCSPETIVGSDVSNPKIVSKPSYKVNLASPVEVYPRIKRLSRQETEIDEPVFQWKLSSPPPRRSAQHSRGKIG